MTAALREVVFLLRFFRVVSPVPPLMTATFVVVTMTSGGALLSDINRASSALTPVLLLQCFAASSGFAVPARRGHYDLLLTRGSRRSLVAVVHWVASAAPGLICWAALACAESFASGGRNQALIASGTLAAVFLVSTLPWACTVALPRFAGGIGWLLVFVTCATTFAANIGGRWSIASTRINELSMAAWSFLIYPAGAVGQPLTTPGLIAVSPGLFVATAAMFTACRWVARTDVPLEAAQ